MLKERLAQLQAQKEQLELQLEEVRYLIQGYENTIKAQADQAGEVGAEATGDTEGWATRVEPADLAMVWDQAVQREVSEGKWIDVGEDS